jgi:hypothetical protein
MAGAATTEGVRVRYVRVTNGTEEVWSDRYDGVPVMLMPGESKDLALDMALHFFGYAPGADAATMLLHMAGRWAKTDGDWGSIRADAQMRKRVAEEFFKRFRIEPIVFKLVEERRGAAPEAPVPADDQGDDDRVREPTAVKDLAQAGMTDPDAEGPPSPGRGHPRRDQHGRRRE